jgi:hypothetical protein
MTGELFNEKYSFTVGRCCFESVCCTTICRSGSVWLLQTEVILLRPLLSARTILLCASSNMLCSSPGLLHTGTCLLRTSTMLRSLRQTTLQAILRPVQEMLQPSQQLLPGSRAMLCSSTSELLCSRSTIMCSTSSLLRYVIPQSQLNKKSKAGDICPPAFFMRRLIFDPARGAASAHRYLAFHTKGNRRQAKENRLTHRIAM